MPTTASHLYDYLQCHHRVWRDVHGPVGEVTTGDNAFMKLLWEKGVEHEEKMLAMLGDYVDISKVSFGEKEKATQDAMREGKRLIYQGVLRDDDLLGIPDLLELQEDGSYMPIDIKSGMGLKGENESDEGKPKKEYAMQLCLYSDLLERQGWSKRRVGKILDGHGQVVQYALDVSGEKGNFWDEYVRILNIVRLLRQGVEKNTPALCSACKVCPWKESCKKWCEEKDDPTLLFYLGRKVRDTLAEDLYVNTVQDLLDLDVEDAMTRKKHDKQLLKGVAETTLMTMKKRALVMRSGKPTLYAPMVFPQVAYELFFDIEDDPTQEFVYMHGVYERGPDGERYVEFTAKECTKEAERETWSAFWKFIRGLPKDDFAVYYYSQHEKTTYRRMQRQYPDIITEEEVEEFFENPNVIDLYGVVQKNTDWPLGSYSLKAIAQYLGFQWRDEDPSGANSIEWYNNYLETKDPEIMERILKYNEDDCRATMVVKDGLVGMNKEMR